MRDILIGDEKPNPESEPYGIKWTERRGKDSVKITFTQPIQSKILDIAEKMGYTTEFGHSTQSGIFAYINKDGKNVAEVAGDRVLYIKDSDMRKVVFEYGKSLDVKTPWNKDDNTLLRMIGCK